MNLKKLGFDDFFKTHFDIYEGKGYIPARVISQQKNNYLICFEDGIANAKLAGKFLYNASIKKDFPTVGDWVAVKLSENDSQAIIHAVLTRKTAFARKQPISGGRKIKNGIIVGGSTEEQVIASNVDTVFIVSGMDDNFNLQRVERYITLAYNSGAIPVIILNKMDCCESVDDYISRVHTIASGLAIHPVSVLKNLNMNIFNQYLQPGKTVVLLGSSGVGKSTITNYLIGEEKQKTNTVSEFNKKGRHTTTSSQLIFHSSGGMIIDTPGLRELQLWGEHSGLEQNFDDIISIISQCKYRDCKHDKEPGCAIRAALEEGRINYERFDSYIKQSEELERLSGRIKENQMYLSGREKLKAKILSQKRKGNLQHNSKI
jgi:ribosome biogenesis GTPase